MKKTVFISAPLVLIFLVIVTISMHGFGGVKSKCRQISGIVTAIYEDGTKDAVFKLAGQNSVFYINKGLEKQFSIDALLARLKGKEVTILYADNFSPLGAIAECRHISELSANGETVYSEFPEK